MPNGNIIHYHDICDVIKVMLGNEQITNGWIYNFSPNNIDHWSGYPAWMEYQVELERKKLEEQNVEMQLLLPVVFIDDYLCDKTRNSSNTGIYFSLANFSTQIYFKPISKCCICTCKCKDFNLQEVLDEVLW